MDNAANASLTVLEVYLETLICSQWKITCAQKNHGLMLLVSISYLNTQRLKYSLTNLQLHVVSDHKKGTIRWSTNLIL